MTHNYAVMNIHTAYNQNVINCYHPHETYHAGMNIHTAYNQNVIKCYHPHETYHAGMNILTAYNQNVKNITIRMKSAYENAININPHKNLHVGMKYTYCI